MNNLVLQNETRASIEQFITHPSHALLLTAPIGAGKASLAHFIASQLFDVASDKLTTHPHIKIVRPEQGKTISVEEIRDAIHFTTLRPIGKAATTRIIIIEDSHRMTPQAQNALLKTIEQPPVGTVLILTALSERSLLPTIRSRVQHIAMHPPTLADVQRYFQETGYKAVAIEKAALMSGGLPGLMHALLEADTSHPLFAATLTAREILQKSLFDRLILVENLAKQRQLWTDTLFILAQMAHMALQQGHKDVANVRRWQKILNAVYQAQKQTSGNAQTKLVLLHFMLVI